MDISFWWLKGNNKWVFLSFFFLLIYLSLFLLCFLSWEESGLIGRFFLFLVGKEESKNLTLDFWTQTYSIYFYLFFLLKYSSKRESNQLSYWICRWCSHVTTSSIFFYFLLWKLNQMVSCNCKIIQIEGNLRPWVLYGGCQFGHYYTLLLTYSTNSTNGYYINQCVMCPALQIYEHPRPKITKDPFLAQTLKWFQLHPAIKWHIQKRTKKKKRTPNKFLFFQDRTCMFHCKLLHNSIIKILGDTSHSVTNSSII